MVHEEGLEPVVRGREERMSVEDNKAAVRRFTQALDSNDLSICLRFARRPALTGGARESTLTRGATITLISRS